MLHVWDANNHQVTWGVLASVLWAVKDFINSMHKYKTMSFGVYDGVHMVGRGTIMRFAEAM